MHHDKTDHPNQGTNSPNPGRQKGFDKDQPLNNPSSGTRDRDVADDRGQELKRQRGQNTEGIPELDEPNVDGVGEEGRDEHERMTRDDSSGSER